MASWGSFERIGGHRELPVVIVERRNLVAREVVDDLCSVVRQDPQNQGVIAGAGIDRPLAVARERHDMRGLRLVEQFRATDRVDRKHLSLGARPCDQLPTLLVIVECPNVFRALGAREAFRLSGLGIDSVDVAARERPRVQRVVTPERQRGDEQLAGVGEHLRVLPIEPIDDTAGARPDEHRAAALSHTVGEGNVIEPGPRRDSASSYRAVGVNRSALELALEECVGAIEHEALSGHRGNARARCENQPCQSDSNSRL